MIRKHIAAFILALALAGCGKSSPKDQAGFVPPPVPVRLVEIVVRDVPLYFEEIGTITPFQTAEVKPQVNGLIQEVHFKEGEWVEKGDLLYTIDEAAYAIKVQEVQALLAQNLANLNNAKKKLERYQSLLKQDLIAKVEWDELETHVALNESMVKADQARLAHAHLDLGHCRIVAPISGRTGKTALQAGNMAAMGTTLVTLSQEKTLYVDFSLTEKELQQLPSTTPSLAIFAAGGEECLAEGAVTFLDHTIDAQSGMLSARGLLSVKHKPLWSGQSVRVHLFFGKKDQAKLIPLKAIKTNQHGSYVFSVKADKTVEMRTVKLGPEEKGMIVVEEGLDGAGKIVTEGQMRLFPGSTVEEVQ